MCASYMYYMFDCVPAHLEVVAQELPSAHHIGTNTSPTHIHLSISHQSANQSIKPQSLTRLFV
jgi:hypothetical protein